MTPTATSDRLMNMLEETNSENIRLLAQARALPPDAQRVYVPKIEGWIRDTQDVIKSLKKDKV